MDNTRPDSRPIQPAASALSALSRFVIRPAEAQLPMRVPLSSRTIFLSERTMLCRGDDDYYGHDFGLLWDIAAGKPTRILARYTQPSTVAVTPDGRWVLAGYSNHLLSLWDMRPKKLLGVWEKRTVQPQRVLAGHTDWVFCCAISDNGARALSGAADHTMRLWDLGTGETLRVFEGHTDTVWSVALSADGRSALSGSRDTTMRLWDTNTGQCLKVMRGHSSAIESILFSPDGASALSGCADETLRLWDLSSGQCRLAMGQGESGPIQGVGQIASQTDWQTCISVSAIAGLRLWDLRTGEFLCGFDSKNFTSAVYAPEVPGPIMIAGSGTVHFFECIALT